MFTFTFTPAVYSSLEVEGAAKAAPAAEVKTTATPITLKPAVKPAPAVEKKAEAPSAPAKEEHVRSHKQSYIVFCYTGRKDAQKEMTAEGAYALISSLVEEGKKVGYPTKVEAFQASEKVKKEAAKYAFLKDWVAKGAWVCRNAAIRAQKEGSLPEGAEPKEKKGKKETKAKGGKAALLRAAKALLELKNEEELKEIIALLK